MLYQRMCSVFFGFRLPLVLQLMQSGIDEQDQSQMYAQLSAVIASLKNIIQTLGFVEYHAESGTDFDPSRMECLGFVENGEPNKVARVERPGYMVQNTIIRPCGVILTRQIDRKKQTQNGDKP